MIYQTAQIAVMIGKQVTIQQSDTPKTMATQEISANIPAFLITLTVNRYGCKINDQRITQLLNWPRSRIVRGDGLFLDKNVDHTGSYDIS